MIFKRNTKRNADSIYRKGEIVSDKKVKMVKFDIENDEKLDFNKFVSILNKSQIAKKVVKTNEDIL